MIAIHNEQIKIVVKKTGAELCEISSIKNNTQFMWNADPEIWGNFAPNLFPIIGMLKADTYYFEGKKYQLSKHGFIRNNSNFKIVEQSDLSVTFMLTYDDESLKIYPFRFEYYVIYQLIENKLHISYKVVNSDSKPIYFSVGGHPAFKCPVYDYECYADYQFVFDKEEASETHLLNLKNGLVTKETRPVFDTPKSINLHYDLFNNDALIFKDLKSIKVTLSSKNKGDILSVYFEDFPYLGIWAKPKANYICIEPWLGITDSEDSNQQLINKEGIIKLDVNKEFKATYIIEIHKSHLV